MELIIALYLLTAAACASESTCSERNNVSGRGGTGAGARSPWPGLAGGCESTACTPWSTLSLRRAEGRLAEVSHLLDLRKHVPFPIVHTWQVAGHGRRPVRSLATLVLWLAAPRSGCTAQVEARRPRRRRRAELARGYTVPIECGIQRREDFSSLQFFYGYCG